MVTRRRTAAGLRVVPKGRHDALGLKRHAALRVVSKKRHRREAMRRPNNSARVPEGCVPHRKLTLLEAFQRSPPKGQLVSAAGGA
jgi:hypothetical protein